jgi:hypothetical protein
LSRRPGRSGDGAAGILILYVRVIESDKPEFTLVGAGSWLAGLVAVCRRSPNVAEFFANPPILLQRKRGTGGPASARDVSE